jgi:conjugal transfer pilus assembly protein TraW
MESQWQERASQHSVRPTPVGLSRATRKRRFHYDTSMTLSQAILDEQGRILYPAGTRVNGLEQRPDYAPCWLLFDGDDVAQRHWAAHEMNQCKNPKLILTGGSVRDAELELDAVIYFDQGARLSSRFQLQAVPARITRDANRLLIEEFMIKENGDAI